MKRAFDQIIDGCQKKVSNLKQFQPTDMLLSYDSNIYTVNTASDALIKIMSGIEVEYTLPWRTKDNDRMIISALTFASFAHLTFVYGMIHEQLEKHHIKVIGFKRDNVRRYAYCLFFCMKPDNTSSYSAVLNYIRYHYGKYVWYSTMRAESAMVVVTDCNIYAQIESDLMANWNECEIIKGQTL